MAFPISGASSPVFKPIAPNEARPAADAPKTGAAEGGQGFTKAVGDALSNISDLENQVAKASEQAATGDLGSVTDFMIANTEAQLATEITVAVRDRAITAFNDIMRMQI